MGRGGAPFIFGIPVFWGDQGGKPVVQRFAFTSIFSQPLKTFVPDERFEPVRKLVGHDARIGDDEMEGVVINR